MISAYHAKFFAHELMRRHPADGVDRLSQSLFDASVNLNPHQIEAALFDYEKHGARVSVIEKLRGKSGWVTLARLEVTAFKTTEALLFSGLTDDGQVLDQESEPVLCG